MNHAPIVPTSRANQPIPRERTRCLRYARRMHRLALVVVALAGCHPVKPTNPAVAPLSCEAAAPKVYAANGGIVGASGERSVLAAIAQACTEDRWSADTRDCFRDETMTCAQPLPAVAKARLDAALVTPP